MVSFLGQHATPAAKRLHRLQPCCGSRVPQHGLFYKLKKFHFFLDNLSRLGYYAVETKFFAQPAPYLPRQVTGVRRKRRIGQPDMKHATINHCERTNLSVRLFTKRFTRCTLGYSKKIENLRHAAALFCWHFNFVRVHSAHGMTPAKAAGIVQNAMTIEELLKSGSGC